MSDFLGWFQEPTPRWVAIGLAILVWLLLDEIRAHASGLGLAGRVFGDLKEQVARVEETLEELREQVAGIEETVRDRDYRDGVVSRFDDIEARLRELEGDDDDDDDDYP